MTILFNLDSSIKLFFLNYKNINKMNTSTYESYRHQSMYESPMKSGKIEQKRNDSIRNSMRKPIFQNSFYYSSKKKNRISQPVTFI